MPDRNQKSASLPRSFIDMFFSPALEFRVRLFNVLAMAGVANGFVNGAVVLEGESISSTLISFASGFASLFILLFTLRTRRYKTAYLLSIICVFLGVFPALFFSNSGYYSSIPYFFVFAVVFTVFMLEGKQALIVAGIEIVFYLGLYLFAYYFPESVMGGIPDERTMLISVIVGSGGVSLSLGWALHTFFRLYNEQQKRLDEQNAVLAQTNRLKTEFLQDIKHEVRNPLHVISLGAGIVSSYMEGQVDAGTAQTALNAVQNEALRLGRMISGMVELANMSEHPASREKLDFAAMLRKCAGASKLQAEKKRIALRLDIAADLPYVYAEAGQLERVPVNLLQNAVNSTNDGEISVEAAADRQYITVRVSDTGVGIPRELLPRVFERGVSGRGGKGYGLSICRTIVEAHGGTIEIESEPGKGTAVTFTIPVYGGQGEESGEPT